MKKFKIGIIGCGNMSQAIIRGLVAHTFESIIVSDFDMAKLDSVKSDRVAVTTNNQEVISQSEYVFLAIKPQVAEEVISTATWIDGGSDCTIISIMAGINISSISAWSRCGKVVRVMPNLLARIGQSNNCYSYIGLSGEEVVFVEKLLSSFGQAFCIEEKYLNVVTGISGSGPAFVFSFVSAFIKNGIDNGLSEELALKLAVSTIKTSAMLVGEMGQTNLDGLIDSVCSKGGTTIEGINYLKEQNFVEITNQAINKAISRAAELEKTL